MNINTITQYVTYALALIGILAFIVSAIVQVIKDLPGLKNIQTSIVALVSSMILCPLALMVMCTYYKAAVTWYYIAASVIAAFIVYLVQPGVGKKLRKSGIEQKYKDSEGE